MAEEEQLSALLYDVATSLDPGVVRVTAERASAIRKIRAMLLQLELVKLDRQQVGILDFNPKHYEALLH
jgi:hypothetical protein